MNLRNSFGLACRFVDSAATGKDKERGVATAVFVLGLASFLAAGVMTVDISHQITAGVELQNVADAAAMAGAAALDGTIGGITAATDRALATTTTVGNNKANAYDFDKAISLSRADVRFGVSAADLSNGGLGYSEADAKLRADTIRFIKVKIPTHYAKGVFTKVLMGKQFLGVTRESIAAQSLNPDKLEPNRGNF
jgi:uncharacterized membrane protein